MSFLISGRSISRKNLCTVEAAMISNRNFIFQYCIFEITAIMGSAKGLTNIRKLFREILGRTTMLLNTSIITKLLPDFNVLFGFFETKNTQGLLYFSTSTIVYPLNGRKKGELI